MNIINFESIPLPRLTFNMVDFTHVNIDDSCGNTIVSFPLLIQNDKRFDAVIDLLHDNIRCEYYPFMSDYIVEPEFEASLNHNLNLTITMNDYGNYEFNLFNCTDDGEVYSQIQVDLSDKEIDLFRQYMIDNFESDEIDQLNQIREDVVKTVNSSLPHDILDKMKLVSDGLSGNRYRSAWITDDDRQCICCEIQDYTDDKYPVKIIKFGF